MGLRFFADHCISREVIDALRDRGHEVVRLKDAMPANSPDADVISKAQEKDSILLSLNGDFADIVTYPPSQYKGIVALQLRNHPEGLPQLMERLHAYLLGFPSSDHYSGRLFVVEAHRIRVKG